MTFGRTGDVDGVLSNGVTASQMTTRRQSSSLGNRTLIGLVTAFGLLNVLYSGYLVSSSESSSSSWNGLDGFHQWETSAGVRGGGWKGQSSGVQSETRPPLMIKYVGVAGLGHRLIRMSSVYHLARILQVPEIEIMWRGFCPSGRAKPNIFQLLFGNSTMMVPSLAPNKEDQRVLFPFLSHNSPESLSQALFPDASSKVLVPQQEVKIINEVEGYTHMYDNQEIQKVNPPYYGKLTTDFEFYTALLKNYQFRRDVEQLFAPYLTDDSVTIIGVHIRAGNGEVGDFEKYRQLGQGNLEGWLSNITNVLQQSVVKDPRLMTQSRKKAVIFLATDTSSVVDYFRQRFDDSIPILVTPQDYPTTGGGVSYNGDHANLTTCLDSWKYQMMDMVGLGEYADVLIAGQYSSFTQSLPLSRILNSNNDNQRRQRFFCDVDKYAQTLKCYDSTKGIENWFAGKDAIYVGANVDTRLDINLFAGPQIFLPTDLDLSSLKQMIGRGGQKKKNRQQ